MCLAVYVGSSVEQPLVPWGDPPGFHVRKLSGHREVKRRLGKPFIYDVGAHTSCACGFMRPHPSEEEEMSSWSASMGSLVAWMRAAVATEPVEVLVCWLGDESKKPTRRTIGVDDLSDFDFGSGSNEPVRLRVHA